MNFETSEEEGLETLKLLKGLNYSSTSSTELLSASQLKQSTLLLQES